MLTGVAAESAGLIGPAVPSRVSAPPPWIFVESENGNEDVLEKSRSTISTCSSRRGLRWPMVRPRRRLPEVTLTSFTDRSSEAVPAVEGEAEAFAGLAPRLEKFQSPEGDCT